MTRRMFARMMVGPLALTILVQAGCSTMLKDTRVSPPAQARHCEGSEFVTSTHVAALPIPVVAFFTPRITTNAPDSGAVLAKCGGKQQVNRSVQANYTACVPAIFLSTIVSLGIVGFCPTQVQYEADIVE